MTYRATGRSLPARACWRDGRGALRCKRPGRLAFGADTAAPPATLPGSTKKVPGGISPEIFLIAQLNRFKGPGVPAGQSLGESKFSSGVGISEDVALDAITVVGRRLQGSLETIADEGARQMLVDIRTLLEQGDPSGAGLVIKYVKDHLVDIGTQVAAYGDALGLPPAQMPSIIGAGLMTTKNLAIVGGVALLLLVLRRKGGH